MYLAIYGQAKSVSHNIFKYFPILININHKIFYNILQCLTFPNNVQDLKQIWQAPAVPKLVGRFDFDFNFNFFFWLLEKNQKNTNFQNIGGGVFIFQKCLNFKLL